jgi:hypothetical protein
MLGRVSWIGAGRSWKNRRVDAVAQYRRASEENNVGDLIETLAPDAELISPLTGHMTFRGHDDLRVLLGAVYGSLTGLRWKEEIGNGSLRVVTGDCRVAGLRLADAMVLELRADGKIVRIRPHLRPWLSTTVFAVLLGARLLARPAVLRRALTRA